MSKNNKFGKFLAFTTTIAAIGGTCYLFRDEIMQSSIYKKAVSLLAKVKNKDQEDDDFYFDDDFEDDFEDTIFSDKAKKDREYTSITINPHENDDTPATDDDDFEDDFEDDFDDDKDFFKAPETQEITEEANNSDEKGTETKSTEEKQDDTSVKESDIPDTKEKEDMHPIKSASIPSIPFGGVTEVPTWTEVPDVPVPPKKEESSPTAYEYEGLSDVSEDPDVLEEQDRLDF